MSAVRFVTLTTSRACEPRRTLTFKCIVSPFGTWATMKAWVRITGIWKHIPFRIQRKKYTKWYCSTNIHCYAAFWCKRSLGELQYFLNLYKGTVYQNAINDWKFNFVYICNTNPKFPDIHVVVSCYYLMRIFSVRLLLSSLYSLDHFLSMHGCDCLFVVCLSIFYVLL